MDARPSTRDRAWVYRRALTLPEVLLWRALRGRQVRGLHIRRQHPIGPYVLDFYCDALKLDIEVDGQSHYFGDRPERDDRRDAWLAAQGIRTLRISASTVLRDAEHAVLTILSFVDENPLPIGAPRRWTSPNGGGSQAE